MKCEDSSTRASHLAQNDNIAQTLNKKLTGNSCNFRPLGVYYTRGINSV